MMVHTGLSVGSGKPRTTTEGRFRQLAACSSPPPRSRWLKSLGLLLVAIAVLAVAGCGGSDTPAVCELETLSRDVGGLRDIDLKADGAADEIQTSLDSIQTD